MSGSGSTDAAGKEQSSSKAKASNGSGGFAKSEKSASSQKRSWRVWFSQSHAQPAAFEQSSLYKKYRHTDRRLRQSLKSSVHSLVAAFLVIALIVGAVCLILFLSIRIGQESSATAVAARDAAREWTQSLQSGDVTAEKGALNNWLATQQASLGQVVEESLPMAITWAEAQGHSLVHAYNLSEIIDDMKALYLTVIPPKACSAEQKRECLIALAGANLQAKEASEHHANLSTQIGQARDRLDAKLKEMEDSQADAKQNRTGDWLAIQAAVVHLDQQLKELDDLHTPAHRRMDEMMERAGHAQEDLARCQRLEQRQPNEQQDPVVQQLGACLQAASSHFWKLQYREAASAVLVNCSAQFSWKLQAELQHVLSAFYSRSLEWKCAAHLTSTLLGKNETSAGKAHRAFRREMRSIVEGWSGTGCEQGGGRTMQPDSARQQRFEGHECCSAPGAGSCRSAHSPGPPHS